MKGRIGIFEVFYMDEQVASRLSEKIDEEELKRRLKRRG